MEKIAIIGMGISGMAVALAYAKEVDTRKLEIDCYDDEESFGRGFPFRKDSDQLLINLKKDKISYDYENLEDFKNWLDDQAYSFEEYVPRHIFGKYTQARLSDTIKEINANEKFCSVKSLEWIEKKGQWKLETHLGNIKYYDRVHLCCGELPQMDVFDLAQHEKYINQIYPCIKKLIPIRQNNSVTIIGTSLAAVDVARYLLVEKDIKKLYIFSRSNIIPSLRLEQRDIDINIMTYDKCLDIIESGNGVIDFKRFDSLFNQELESHGLDFNYLMDKYTPGIKSIIKSMDEEDDLGKIQTILSKMTIIFNRVWLSFTSSDKIKFNDKYEDFIQAFGNPIPMPTGKILLEAINSNRLTLLHDVSDIVFNKEEKVFQVIGESKGSKSVLAKSDFVCNATGLDNSLKTLSRENTLIGKMLNYRYLQVDDSGGITVLPQELQVISPKLGVFNNLLAHGVLISGVQLKNNSTSVIQENAHDSIRGLYKDKFN